MMRIKVVEILKFIVAVSIGFTLRTMFESSQTNNKHRKQCDISTDTISDLSLFNIHEQLRQPHQPNSITDVIEYRYFNSSVVFDTHLGHVKTLITRYHRSDIRDIIKQVESFINAGVTKRYKMKNVVNGFERIDPVRGKEYVIDLELVPESSTDNEAAPQIYRYSIVRPFSYAQLVSRLNVSPALSSPIHLLYILNDSNTDLVQYIFAHHSKHIVGFFPINVTVHICSRSSLSRSIENDFLSFSQTHKSVSSYKLDLVWHESCTFRAAQMANTAVRSVVGVNPRVVILNANVNVTHQFLQRCSSVLSESVDFVYVPIPFAVFLHRSRDVDDDISEGAGLWDHDNFEVLCIHKNLFVKVNGLNEQLFSSEAHRTILDELIRLKKQVFRSTDPSVRVFYHNINCNDQESLRYSNVTYCEHRQRRTFQSSLDSLNAIKLQ